MYIISTRVKEELAISRVIWSQGWLYYRGKLTTLFLFI
jgi:hypothetical protein